MSKKFKQQDYFRYKRLGSKWRRPRGLQSKLKIRKGGAGNSVSIGYGTPRTVRNKIDGLDVVIVNNVDELSKVGDDIALVASSVGARKAKMIRDKAKELDIRVLNMKKMRRAERMSMSIDKKRAEKKTKEKKKEETKETKKEEGHKEENKEEEHKEGYAGEHHHDSLKEKDHAGETKAKKPVRPVPREEKK